MAHPLNRPTGAPPRRAAFTLIELLVVVSIIALLIGILLPTLGEARRQAGIVSCVATIRSNGQGVASYTADNQDRLPSAPPGTGLNEVPNTGSSSQPAIAFANRVDGGVNGWTFNPAERGSTGVFYQTPQGTQITADTRVGIEAFWFIAFGNYMTETRGDAMLQEPFVSPTDRTTKAYWNTYRGIQYSQRNSSEDGHFLRVASYWYVLPALFHKSLFQKGGPLDDSANSGNPGGQNPNLLPPDKWRVFHRSNAIQFTSNKVAFYQYFTTHDGIRTFWNDPRLGNGKGASISISMFDGSAKNVKVYDENQVFQPNPDYPLTDAGTLDQVGIGNQFQNQWNGNGRPYFKFTFGGLAGRDIP